LSHQNTAQISTELLESIVENTSTQIYGKISGIDANRIAKILDPQFAKELSEQITSQPDFVFTAKTRPPSGHPYGIPIQFKSLFPPHLMIDERETAEFIQKMKKQYTATETTQSIFNSYESKKNKWMQQSYAKFRNRQEWEIIKFLKKQDGNLKTITEGVKSNNRDKTRELIDVLQMDGLLNIASSRKIVAVLKIFIHFLQMRKDSIFPKASS
jgi:hypothetical protein